MKSLIFSPHHSAGHTIQYRNMGRGKHNFSAYHTSSCRQETTLMYVKQLNSALIAVYTLTSAIYDAWVTKELY